MSRRKAREIAFKVLFQVDQVEADPKQAFEYLLREKKLKDNDYSFSWELVDGCLKNLDVIDKKIMVYARDWSIERMLSVDRNIMRLASYEILYIDSTEDVIAIDEAIEISKKYGDENSGKFVNAILDKISGEKK
ncbi:Transcription termination protein NusB [Candidatus Syntrophocurvum alkaliphilum]|uniref:Transcription antitermination protein NusB n=1 Tax=Candidatus Syntrophocurvum alkaliphilum TaxID=2293317 RepID=A0A6I6D737_9FIRM|nr:transcription antitermination factor NusB [Candidatus Syntrophocurvum alkaliphilum]QGT98963.1 Transcription termination protein NusB [Candidatus Syntrophocurvum alkaliphilum]